MKKVILDVDTGIDDALGIMLAVKSGELDILGITTVNGNVSLETATINTCKIIDFLQVPYIPVVQGSSRPLLRKSYFEHRIHGQDGLGGALLDVPVQKQVSDGFGPDFIIDQVQQYPGEVTLIMTGPLTNLALAIIKCPSIVSSIKEVIFMGGVVSDVGNVTPTSEYNMYVDPEAAKVVFEAGFVSLVQIGLDVTRKALLTNAHMELIAKPEMASYVKQSTSDYMKRYYERNKVMACAMHDPLAVAVALNRNLVETNAFYVDIETNSTICDGQTVCDFQNRLTKDANIDVALQVDTDAFIDLFITTLNN